jgi:hypothetical protein
MFLGLPDPDPLVRDTDQAPAPDSKKSIKKHRFPLFCDFSMTFYLRKIM